MKNIVIALLLIAASVAGGLWWGHRLIDAPYRGFSDESVSRAEQYLVVSGFVCPYVLVLERS